MHVELGEDMGDVRVRGAVADKEHGSDLPVSGSRRQQPENLDFSFRQFGVAAALWFSPWSEERGFSQRVRDELIERKGQTFRPGVVECVLREAGPRLGEGAIVGNGVCHMREADTVRERPCRGEQARGMAWLASRQ